MMLLTYGAAAESAAWSVDFPTGQSGQSGQLEKKDQTNRERLIISKGKFNYGYDQGNDLE